MHQSRHPLRRAYTLMEMMLVLAVIVVVAGISIPVIRTMMTDSRLDAAADQVKGLTSETRARAMNDSRPWKLAYLPNTGIFQMAPEESDEWGNTSQELGEKQDLRRDTLPTEIVFASSHDDILGHQQPLQPGGTWEIIAVYMPNGSARDDLTTYFGKPGLAPMRVQIRGLTGIATIEQFNPNRPGQ